MAAVDRQMLIHGEWVGNQHGDMLEVLNPATREVEARIPSATEADLDRAVRSAKEGFALWHRTPAQRRGEILHLTATILREYAERLALAITLEMGKPIKHSRMEVISSARQLDYFADEALRISREVLHRGRSGSMVIIVREPMGVAGAITPYNFPLSLLVWKLAPALASGCSLVAKPDERAPSVALMLGEIMLEAGLPPGVFNVITGDGLHTGRALVDHPGVRKIAFTGSRIVGKEIAARAAVTCKRVTLELGGQCPAIVMPLENLERISADFIRQAFKNSGQYCYRINRAYVQREIYDQFIQHLINEVERLNIGLPLEAGTDLGPLAHIGIYEQTMNHIEDALAKGANLIWGGRRIIQGEFAKGIYLQPAILGNTDHSMRVMREETFGPVLGLMPIDSMDQGIALANDTPYGLAAYVYTDRTEKSLSVADQIEAGSVWINSIDKSYEFAPFGGMKESGYGRERSRYAMEEYLERKTIYVSPSENG